MYHSKEDQRKVTSTVIRVNRKVLAVLVTGMLMLGFLPAVALAAYTPGEPVSFTETTTVTLDQSGWYYVEAWGGNGGSSSQNTLSSSGGTSQRVSGYFHFSKGDILYVQVGAAGGNGSGGSGLTGGSAGAGGVGDYFGSGYSGGKGGAGVNGYFLSGLGGGGGGGGGAASGILLNSKDVSSIIIASGGGGGAGGYSQLIKRGGVGGDSGKAGGETSVTSNNGASWSADSTEGYDGGFIRHDGADASSSTFYGGGGAGGGGGGWDGSIGGGGQSGNGGKASMDSEAGGGAAGGQGYSTGDSAAPSGVTASSENARTTSANGQVYLTFLAETYNVTYTAPDATSGTPPTDSNDYLENDTVTVLGDNGILKDGYDFAGWSDGTTVYSAEGPGEFDITGDTTLTAVWEPDYDDPYWLQVTYSAPDATSGTPPTDPNNYIANSKSTVLGAGTLKRSGYSFVGWSDGTTTYKTGDEIELTSDTTLTAVWKKNSSKSSSPQTGDYSNTWIWMAAGLASALCIAGLIVWIKRSKKEIV